MVSRSEVDMLDIRDCFKKMYGASLYTTIQVRSTALRNYHHLSPCCSNDTRGNGRLEENHSISIMRCFLVVLHVFGASADWKKLGKEMILFSRGHTFLIIFQLNSQDVQ